MEKQNQIVAVSAGAGMLVLIFDGKTALTGAAEGITLCLSTLIPSLFPFILLSILLTGALAGQSISPLKWIRSVCNMPEDTESLLAVSFLGGYPVGAQNIALLYKHGQLTHAQSMRMLPLCNNAGPAFIFGVLGALFTNNLIPWILWFIQIFSSICVGYLIPAASEKKNIHVSLQKIRITDALSQAVKVMSLICGWVVLMRMILAFMNSWFLWMFPHSIQIILTGVLELSNGCVRLCEIQSEGLRFVIASGLLSLGGICVILQTASVADGISMKYYFLGKILQTGISILLSCLFQFIFPENMRIRFTWPLVVAFSAVALALFLLQYSKKVVAFRLQLVYNQSINIKEVSSCCFAKK